MNKRVNFKKISQFPGPEQSPGYLLWRVSTQWRSAIEAALKPIGLTHPQFVVLTALAWLTKDGQQISQINVGRAAGLDPNTTSQIIRGLEKKGFLKRVKSLDERSKSPQLTAEGSQVIGKALPAVEQADARFFAVVKQSELSELIKIFQDLIGQK